MNSDNHFLSYRYLYPDHLSVILLNIEDRITRISYVQLHFLWYYVKTPMLMNAEVIKDAVKKILTKNVIVEIAINYLISWRIGLSSIALLL